MPSGLSPPNAAPPAPRRTVTPARPRASAAKPRAVGRVPRSAQANRLAQIGMVKTSSTPSLTSSQRRQRAEKPIHAKTLVKVASASQGTAGRGTAKPSPRQRATAACRIAATTPANLRANRGVQVCKTTFIASQPTPHPSAVASSARTPSERVDVTGSGVSVSPSDRPTTTEGARHHSAIRVQETRPSRLLRVPGVE